MFIEETISRSKAFIVSDVAEMVEAAGYTVQPNSYGGYDFAATYNPKANNLISSGVRLSQEQGDGHHSIYMFTGRGVLGAQTHMSGMNAAELVAAIVFAYLAEVAA